MVKSMATSNTKSKEYYERVLAERFLRLYNTKIHDDIKFTRHGDPLLSEPDCICDHNLAIEIVGIYDNAYQAAKLFSNSKTYKTVIKPEYQLLTLRSLVEEIGKKINKLNNGNYLGHQDKIILLCNLASPLVTTGEINHFHQNYTTFKSDNHFDAFFDEIWLIWQTEYVTQEEILRLE